MAFLCNKLQTKPFEKLSHMFFPNGINDVIEINYQQYRYFIQCNTFLPSWEELGRCRLEIHMTSNGFEQFTVTCHHGNIFKQYLHNKRRDIKLNVQFKQISFLNCETLLKRVPRRNDLVKIDINSALLLIPRWK